MFPPPISLLLLLFLTNGMNSKLRKICYALQQKVLATYPSEQIGVVKYTAISGFIFLRFFCPAILGPKLFDLMKEHPEMKTARYLVGWWPPWFDLPVVTHDGLCQTLIAKSLQNLSNLCEFGYKEPYMADMNSLIMENMGRMKEFIDRCSVRYYFLVTHAGKEYSLSHRVCLRHLGGRNPQKYRKAQRWLLCTDTL